MPLLRRDPDRLNRALGALLLLAGTILCYLPAFRGDFIWDDDRHVSENRMLADVRGLRRIWFERGVTPQYYPMTHTSFWLEHRLWGPNPTGFHVTNVVLHGINAIIVWLVLRRLDAPGAFLAAAVFAVHPVNVESVAWISERKNVLATCFFLLSMLAYVRFNFSGYALSLALFVLALLSKTITCSLPAVLVLVLWWKRKLTWKEIALLAPMFVVGVVLAIVTIRMEVHHVGAQGPEWDFSLADRFIIAGKAIWFYVGKLLWPAQLMFSYPRWEIDPARLSQWVPLLAAVGAVAALLVESPRLGRGPFIAALIFIGTLFPALGFFDTYPMRYSFVADHFVYLSSIAFIALVIGVIATAYARWLQRPRIDAVRVRFALVNSLLLLGILGVLSFRQARVYSDAETIWRDTIRKNPESWMARNNLGVLLSKSAERDHAAGRAQVAERKLRDAAKLFAEVERMYPGHAKARLNRAEALAKLGEFDEALYIYESTLAEAHAALGFIYGELARYAEARRQFRRALEIDPDHPAARRGMNVLAGGTPAASAPAGP